MSTARSRTCGPGRDAGDGLAGAAGQDRGVQETHGLAVPVGSSYGSDFNADFHVSFTKEEMAQGKVDYNYTMQAFPSAEAPGLSVFYKDGGGDSSTPTPPTGVASTRLLAHTRSSTWYPRAATKTTWASAWSGSATMIGTAPTVCGRGQTLLAEDIVAPSSEACACGAAEGHS